MLHLYILSDLHLRRAGIIPYVIDERNNLLILLGVSKDKGLYSDLGGRRENFESTLDCALREYGEESRYCLPIDINHTSDVYITQKNGNDDQAILFVELPFENWIMDINRKFKLTKPKNKYEDEMKMLIWVPYSDFFQIPNEKLSYSLQYLKSRIKNDMKTCKCVLKF